MNLPSWEDWGKASAIDFKQSNNKTSSISNIDNLPTYSTNNVHHTQIHKKDDFQSLLHPKLSTNTSKLYYENNGNNDIVSAQSEMNEIRKSAVDSRKVNFNHGGSMNNNASLNNNSSSNHSNTLTHHHHQQYQDTKSYDNMDTYDSSSSQHSINNNSNNYNNNSTTSSNNYKDQRQFNEFKCREICLSTSNKLKFILDYLSKVKDYILKEGSLELEMIKSSASLFLNNKELNYSSSYQISTTLHHPDMIPKDIPKETIYLQSYSLDLQLEIYLCLKAIVECFDSRTDIYLTQLKKIRDISNLATRNAIQNEKAESNAAIQRFKLLLEQQHHIELKQHQNRNCELNDQIQSLQTKLDVLTKEQDVLKKLNQNHLEQQNYAVSLATSQCKLEYNTEKEHYIKSYKLEQENIRNDALRTIEEAKSQHEIHLRLEKEHDSELRNILLKDKELLEHECNRLREELMIVNSKLITEKDILVYRLKEEKDQFEQREQLALSESLKLQTQLKLEMKSITAQYQANDTKKSNDLEMKMNKFREGLLAEHSIEIEKINDRHRHDLQKFIAENQVRMQDQVSKLKHNHEMELNRLIRDNDRLQRIIIRHGGAEHFRANNLERNFIESKQSEKTNKLLGELSKSPIYSSRIITNLTPPSKFKTSSDYVTNKPTTTTTANDKSSSTKTVAFATDHLEVPPPPPTTAINIPVSNELNWGALKDSLQLEEAQFSPKKLPPDHFELNEALATTLSKSSNKVLGYNSIDSNNQRVGSYMNKLEDYLKGRTASNNINTDKDESVSIDTLNNISMPSSIDINNASFNTQVAYKYLKTKEQLGLTTTNFNALAGCDSDESNDSSGGDDFSFNISENSQKLTI